MNFVAGVAVVALGSFSVTEFTKVALPWPLQPWTKMLMVFVLANLAVLVFGLPWATGTTGAGGALLVHKVHRLLSLAGDYRKVAIIQASGRKMAP